MKTVLTSLRWAPGAMLIGLSMSFHSAFAAGGVLREARITQVIRDVKVLPAQAAPRPASVSETVRGDTAVRTGAESRAELTFGDLTIARLGANTIFSFNEGTRTVDLASGAILLRVPKDSGGAKIQTAAVTAAITGTTVMVEYHRDSYAKYLVLEGTMRLYLKGILGESILMHAGQMMILNPNATRLSEVVDFDLERLRLTALLLQPPIGSENLMADAQQAQLEKKAAGELIDTNLVIFGRGTLVTLTDPQSLDVIDRKTAAVTLPTPTPTATPTASPVPTPTPTPTPSPIPTPTPTPSPVPTPTPSPSPIPSPTPTPTVAPSPSKFGTPPPITSFVPYPIDNGTAIQTDPAIARAGVTDFGKIYRDATQDGPFSTWAFTATTPFDTTSGINGLYGPNVPVAAFKFTALQLVGNPTISTANGGATNLALISVGPITTAGGTTFTFSGMQSVLLATQNGSIDISSADLVFQGIPSLIFYARGPGSNLTLGGMGIFNVGTLRLIAENNIQINAPEILTNGVNGGILRGTAGGSLAVNAQIDTFTALVPSTPPTFTGVGGTVSLSALGGTLTVASQIAVSYNDPPVLAMSPPPIHRSASGGVITLDSGLATGTGISLTSNAILASLLNPAAPGTGGSITLITPGSDIIANGATIQADRGTITLLHTGAPLVGTAQITLNGGTIQSETLLASSRGNLTVGTTSPVNLADVTISLLASNNFTWNGGTLVATASASSGNVLFQSGNDISITGAADIERFNGGISDGLNIQLNAGRNLQIGNGLTLLTDGSGLTSGGNITLNSGAAMTIGGAALIHTGPTTASQGAGSNFSLTAGGAITVLDLSATVQIGAGRTLTNGGIISLGGNSYTATRVDGGLDLLVNNSAPGIIGTGGNITLNLTGGLTTGNSGVLRLAINNSNGGQIQTGGNITASMGNLRADQVTVQIDNRNKGFIGNGAGIDFTAATVLTTSSSNFTILNSDLAAGSGGTISSNALIKVTLADANIGKDLNAYIYNSDGRIGGVGGTVTLQINGKLTVTGRIDVFGTLNSTGTITAGQLSGTNVITPAGIQVGTGGITRFTFPNGFPPPVFHTISAGSLTSTGGINFNGPNFGTLPGLGPFDGGQLTINVPSLTFGSSAADNIQGAITFNGGDGDATHAAGSGGSFTVNTTGAITVGSPIQATTGLLPSASEPSGDGGTVNLNSTGGTIAINSAIKVSSADPAGAPRRHSKSGGNINLQSNVGTGVAINISNTGQLLSLLEAAAPGPGGKITILATGASSAINVNGSTGLAPTDTIRADHAGGYVDIRHTGGSGSITMSAANISADVIKVGALGNNGTLTIGGGRISADTILRLYATGTNGSVIFVSDVTLNINSTKLVDKITIAGNSVTVRDNVTVSIGSPAGATRPAEVYVPDITKANYSNFNGGNNSTTGKFILEGTSASPVSGANTFFIAPPTFGPPGGP